MSTRENIHQPRHIGDRVASAVATNVGSWRFIIIQALIMAIWIILNTAGWFIWKWDIYPFIFLNLAMSAEAAFTAPIIMISQNIESDKNQKRDTIESEEVDMLVKLNEQQLDILQLLKAQAGDAYE